MDFARGTWRWIGRNRRRIAAAGVVVGGVYAGYRYVQARLAASDEEQARERQTNARMRQHFESIQRTCRSTALALLPSVQEQVYALLDTERLTGQLRVSSGGSGGGGDKMQVWAQLKVVAVSRTIAAVYAVALLYVYLRVQLYLVGRRLYCDSQEDGGSTLPRLSPDVSEAYLATISHSLKGGVEGLCETVRVAIDAEIAELSLKQRLTLADLSKLFSQAMERIDLRRLCTAYLLPPPTPADSDPLSLESETRDIVESADFLGVARECVSALVKTVLSGCAPFFHPRYLTPVKGAGVASVGAEGSGAEGDTVAMQLAKIVPVVNGQSASVLSVSSLDVLGALPAIEHLSLAVYAAFNEADVSQ